MPASHVPPRISPFIVAFLDDTDSVGAKLKATRVALGLQSEEVARTAGFGARTLRRLERGESLRSLWRLGIVFLAMGYRAQIVLTPVGGLDTCPHCGGDPTCTDRPEVTR